MLSKAQDDDLVINLVELSLRCPSTERADYVERACAPELFTQVRQVMADVTELLERWRAGDREAENELFVSVFPKLWKLARYLLRGERKGHSFQATELLDQLYLRLVKAKDRDWRNRAHFFAIAGRVTRRYLIDRARARPNLIFVGLEDVQKSQAL